MVGQKKIPQIFHKYAAKKLSMQEKSEGEAGILCKKKVKQVCCKESFPLSKSLFRRHFWQGNPSLCYRRQKLKVIINVWWKYCIFSCFLHKRILAVH